MGRRRSLGDLSYGLVIGTLATLALLIIVAPVVIVLTTSFTEGRSLKFPPTGFSLQWYEALFDPSKSRQIHRAVSNSLEVAAWSTAFGMLLGSMAALGIARNRHRLARIADTIASIECTSGARSSSVSRAVTTPTPFLSLTHGL